MRPRHVVHHDALVRGRDELSGGDRDRDDGGCHASHRSIGATAAVRRAQVAFTGTSPPVPPPVVPLSSAPPLPAVRALTSAGAAVPTALRPSAGSGPTFLVLGFLVLGFRSSVAKSENRRAKTEERTASRPGAVAPGLPARRHPYRPRARCPT